MTAPAPPPDGPEQEALCALSDPERAADALHHSVRIARLIALAQDHNVAPIVLRKLAGREPATDEDARARVAAERDEAFIAMMTALLDEQCTRVCGALADAGIPFRVVKGPAFRKDLYPVAADRPYSDIDVLVREAGWADAGGVLRGLGFRQFKRDRFDKSLANREEKWGLEGDPLILVELHTDLVHVPRLRRRVALDFDHLEVANDGGARPFAGHFIVAVIHAAAGHKMHNLRLLVDVLQAVRKLGNDDIDHLAAVLDRLRCHPEISVCLSLVEQLFARPGLDSVVESLRARLRLPACWTPVSAWSVVNAPYDRSGRSKSMRHAFRHYQMTIAPRRSLT